MVDGLIPDAVGLRARIDSVEILRPPGVSQSSGNGGPTADFSSVLAEVGSKLTHTIQQAEATSIAGMKGEAGAYEVASSIMEAEQSLRMAISVRDKIIAAYLEISRMQI